MKIELENQVSHFLQSLAFEPRRTVRAALRRLENEAGDIQPLEAELSGYYRLRVGKYRIIFRYVTGANSRRMRCVYAAPRGLVYEIFAEQLREIMRR